MKNALILLSCLVVSTYLFADTRISYLSGTVTVNRNDQWTPADTKTVLGAKDRIKTAANSRAVLIVDDTTRIWVNQNSEMGLASVDGGNIFSLLAGKIRAKVRLLSGKKFQVKTPVAVASVRGTELILSSEGELAVLEGKVEFSDLNMTQSMEVAEGQIGSFNASGQPNSPRNMTPEEKEILTGEWEGFDGADEQGGGDTQEPQDEQTKKKEEKKEQLQEKLSDLRREILTIVFDMKTDINTTRELTNEIKESDLSAGRTLRDIHGNLVRVEQHLLRPDNQTLQILNLTKRSGYTYGDKRGWGFSTPSGSRLDVMDVTLKMNMSLPEQITEWPSYISSKGEDMHPESVKVRMSNQEDEITSVGEWRKKGQLDNEGKVLNDDAMVFDSYVNGWKVDPNYDAGEDSGAKFKNGSNADGNDSGEIWMWGISPDMKITKDGQTRYINIYTEVYGIDNNGNILNMNTITSGSENPFTVLKQVAGEQITFVRERDGTDFLKRGNLDLVITPDIVIAVAEKLATQAGDLMSMGSSENK